MQTSEPPQAAMEEANVIAEICHNLPGFLDPTRRANLAEGLRYTWRTATVRNRRWLQSRWDQLGYDHRWLTDLEPEAPSPPSQPEL